MAATASRDLPADLPVTDRAQRRIVAHWIEHGAEGCHDCKRGYRLYYRHGRPVPPPYRRPAANRARARMLLDAVRR